MINKFYCLMSLENLLSAWIFPKTESSNSNHFLWLKQMSCLKRKPTICICENKDADQLRGNREADQRLCFRYSESTIHRLLKSEISRFLLSPVPVQPGMCRTCSKTTSLVFPRHGSNLVSALHGFNHDNRFSNNITHT